VLLGDPEESAYADHDGLDRAVAADDHVVDLADRTVVGTIDAGADELRTAPLRRVLVLHEAGVLRAALLRGTLPRCYGTGRLLLRECGNREHRCECGGGNRLFEHEASVVLWGKCGGALNAKTCAPKNKPRGRAPAFRKWMNVYVRL